MEEAYLDGVIRPLINSPDRLCIVKTVDSLGVLLTVEVDRDDMGMLIGKEGKTALAIRHVVTQLGYRLKKRLSVKINENQQ